MYYLCEKYYKPVTVQYCIVDCVSWVPRLTLLDLTKWTYKRALGMELVRMQGTYCMYENVCCARSRKMKPHYTGMILLMWLHLTNYYGLNGLLLPASHGITIFENRLFKEVKLYEVIGQILVHVTTVEDTAFNEVTELK